MEFTKYVNYLKERKEEVKIDDPGQVGEAYNNGLETMYNYALIMLTMAQTEYLNEQREKKVIA